MAQPTLDQRFSTQHFHTEPEMDFFGQPSLDQQETQVELAPNPHFVFPAPSADVVDDQLPRWNTLSSNNRSGLGARRRQRASVSTLPDFSFNPAMNQVGGVPPAMASPPTAEPTTPTSPTTPSRMGHRRGGSEFIGGDGKGGPGLMSTSPTKGDGILPPPASNRLGPPAGRRGHAHRRSGAISCHDMQSILQSRDGSMKARGASAPTTPMEHEEKPYFTPGHARRATSEMSLRTSMDLPALPEPPMDGSPQRRPPSARARVGFAERVEYIRPLSIISSETESSMSTIRGHSVTGSFASISSAGPSSPPPSNRMARFPLETTYEGEDIKARPQTAGDLVNIGDASRDGLGILTGLPPRPKSSSASPPDTPPASDKSQKRRNFAWWDSRRGSATKRASIPSSSSDPHLVPQLSDSPLPSPGSHPEDSSADEETSSATIYPVRKPRKVKSWAHSIISRKPKRQVSKDQLSQTSTPASPAADESIDFGDVDFDTLDANFEPNFDIDNTVTILATPSPKRAPMSSTSTTSPARLWRRSLDEETASPVIDLDAALGPFNTPSLGLQSRPHTRHAPRVRHSMHSLSFTAQSHRRTESAPALVPFETRTAKTTHSTVMDDVFEEEDEEFEAGLSHSPAQSPVLSTTMALHSLELADNVSPLGGGCSFGDTPELDDVSTEDALVSSPATASFREFDAPITPCQERLAVFTSLSTSNSPAGSHLSKQSTPIEVVEDHEEPRASSLTRDSDSTITPTMTPDPSKQPQPIMTLSLPLAHQMVMTPDTLSGSSFSGRDFLNSSQASLDTPRLGTATSSGTDQRSCSFGEPGPDVRMSVDDVPSLSSSRSCRSIMTSPPQRPQYPTSRPRSAFALEDHAATTFGFAPPEQTFARKRSSMASLSRLMGSKSSEGSKLSLEMRPQSQHSTVTLDVSGKKKSKRFSKLMHFWKPSKHSMSEEI